MIYKCKNCGQNYYEKPDFCECGNNVFVLIKSSNNTNSSTAQKYKEDFNILYPNNEYFEQEDTLYNKNNLKILTVFSSVIFVISLILSSIFIYKGVVYKPIFNDKNIVSKNIDKENIPLVDTYWDNSILQKNNMINSNIKGNDVSNLENITFEPPKTNKNLISKNIKTKEKNIVNNTNTNSVKQSFSNTSIRKPDLISSKEETEKKEVEKVKLPKKPEITDKTTNDAKNNEKINDISVKNSGLDIMTEEQEKATFLQYKADLRLRLFQHFPILNVFGYGVAVIGFNISSEGKLNARRFIQQSENKSLNDALYHMLMSVPIYSPPPKYYKGEDIVLKMEFNNGYYSFSFVE